MKKLLALGLSLAMMASLSAVAFAAAPADNNINQNTGGNADSDGKTVLVYTEATEDDNAESYTVIIPADIEVQWGDENTQTATVTVEHKLFAGKQVLVEADALTQLDGKDTVVGNSLDVTMDDFSQAYAGTGANETDTTDFTFTVSGFDAAPLGRYEGVMTFTATYGNVA